jgi:hypothetical protein
MAHAGASELSTVSGRSGEATVSAADGAELPAVGAAEGAADEAIVSGEVAAVAEELTVIGVAMVRDEVLLRAWARRSRGALRLITCGT